MNEMDPAKVSDSESSEKRLKDTVKWNKDRVRELETKLASLKQELIDTKDVATSCEEELMMELIKVYKECSEEWSKASERIEKEVTARREIEKEANGLKEKLDTCLAELASLREGISGTAQVAQVTELYSKYQEASDALRLEQSRRRKSDADLEQFERIVESHNRIDQKLQHSLRELENLQRHIQKLEADIRRKDREINMAQREIVDLQNQVSILMMENQDMQLHRQNRLSESAQDIDMPRLMNISGIREENRQLRCRVSEEETLVKELRCRISKEEALVKEKYERDLQKHMDKASAKVRAVSASVEEQKEII